MYKLKLYNLWQEKGIEKTIRYINHKRSNLPNLSKSQIKEITKLITKAKVIEEGENYLVYQTD